MDTEYGPDVITITDEDGVEYELEILSTVEYQGSLASATAFVPPSPMMHHARYQAQSNCSGKIHIAKTARPTRARSLRSASSRQ